MIIRDQDIYKIALITSIIGISLLIISSVWVEPKEILIKDISSDNINEKIIVQGIITDIKKASKSETYFLNLNDGTEKITLIIFESALEDFEKQGIDIYAFKNKKVKVTGTVTEYNNQLELNLEDSKSLKIEK